jgi:DNA-binding CsgD family transcriptional regulator
MAANGHAFDLCGRRAERQALSERISQTRRGLGGGLVVWGDAGIGKTALLDAAFGTPNGLQVVRLAGAESERRLPYAGLQQLCAPLAQHFKQLPAPQQDALTVALGQRSGEQPSELLVSLAILGLLTEVASQGPLVCAIDNSHWLDRASARSLAFAARRLVSCSVLIIFAAKWVGPELAGLPEIKLEGLSDPDARELLAAAARWPLDERVRDQIVAETRGNPRTLIDLPRSLSPTQFAGGFGLPDAAGADVSASVLRTIGMFTPRTRIAVVAAAADPTGDPTLLRRAMEHLRISGDAIDPAIDSGLLAIGSRVVFQHSAVRTAVYRSASPRERHAAHQALAEATKNEADRDRRAWHRAQAATGPDEALAAELERTASQAQLRGGLAALAAFLERAACLTPAAPRQSLRALAAADVTMQAGALDATIKVLDMVDPDMPADCQARADVIHALALTHDRSDDAPRLLIDAARRLDHVDAVHARSAYRDALGAAINAAGLAGPGGTTTEVALAVRQAPHTESPAAGVVLLDGVAACLSGRYASGTAKTRQALVLFTNAPPMTDQLRWLPLACTSAILTWDDSALDTLSRRRVRLARSAGALADLPGALSALSYLLLLSGELKAAEELVAEAQSVAVVVGVRPLVNAGLGIAALRGRLDPTLHMIEDAVSGAAVRGEGLEVARSKWAAAIVLNAVGRYEEAFTAAQDAIDYAGTPAMAGWAMAELIEAGARSGQTARLAKAVEDLSSTTTAAGTNWALGVQSRSLALLSENATAEALYRTAIERLTQSHARVDLARAHLVYGEWLRRQNRRIEAREQLRPAGEMLESMGASGFADRARRELQATGEHSRKRSAQASRELTARERLIAIGARNGYTNAAIGSELFLSPRTVEWHLRKVFTKLDITSRRQLVAALGAHGELSG